MTAAAMSELERADWPVLTHLDLSQSDLDAAAMQLCAKYTCTSGTGVSTSKHNTRRGVLVGSRLLALAEAAFSTIELQLPL